MENVPWGALAGLVLALTGYVAFLRIMANRSYQSREELYRLGRELMSDDRCSDRDRAFVSHCLHNAMTYRGAFFWVGVGVIYLFRAMGSIVTGHFPSRQINGAVSAKMGRVATLYFVSVRAANPVVGTIAWLLVACATAIRDLSRPRREEDDRKEIYSLACQTAARAG